MSFQESIEELVKKSIGDFIEPTINKAISEIILRSVKESKPITPYLNVNEAAKYLNITRQSLATYMKNGIVKFYRLNGSPRFLQKDLDEAMQPVVIELKKHK